MILFDINSTNYSLNKIIMYNLNIETNDKKFSI